MPRKLIYMGSLAVDAVITMLLLVVSINGANQLWPFLVLSFASGCSAAVGNPAIRSMTPTLVPFELLPNAIALRSTVFQAVVVVGPAVGGLLFALGPEVVYATGAVLMLIAVGFVVPMKLRAIEDPPFEVGGSRLESLLAGLASCGGRRCSSARSRSTSSRSSSAARWRCCPSSRATCSTSARSGWALLRSAPAVGALLAGIMLTRRPLRGMAGRKLLIVVAVFGASMIVFGLSHSFPLSFAALAVSGFADMISMNIRSMITALATPDALRGRVNAVEMVFISASNELGAFESGVAAALIGAVPAVVIGGSLTIICALAWPRLFPQMARIDRLESLHPVAP